MRILILRLLIIFTSIAMTACQTLPTENHLDAGARQHLNTVDGVLIAKQDRIGADVKSTSGIVEIGTLVTGSPILPVLLDLGVTGVRTAKANNLAKPIRENLENYDYAWEFRKQVKQSLEGPTFDELDNFMIVRDEFPGLRGHIIQESNADAVLMIDMKYGFTPTFETMYVQSHAMLFPKSAELEPFREKRDRNNLIEFSDNIYRNQYAASLSTGLKDATTSEHAAFWAELSEEKLVDLLERAGLILADTIANDIGIDDINSDLNLVPKGYVLNTKFDNLNKYSKTRISETDLNTLPKDIGAKEEDVSVPEELLDVVEESENQAVIN